MPFIILFFSSLLSLYTTTGNGTVITATNAPLKFFALQVTTTGAAMTSWDVRLEGSLDNTSFTQIALHTNIVGSGVTTWGTNSAVIYVRSRCAGFVGAGGTLNAYILGIQ